MGCKSCSSGAPGGCQNNGHCATGGCNKLNTYDWLSDLDIPEVNEYDIIEVSFKNGARKGFYRKQKYMHELSGERVVVESGNGYDIGKVSLTGDIVRLQMKKKRVTEDAIMQNVLRVANPRDLERLEEARNKEREVMVQSRVIARELGLDMKVGDVEFQGDKRKATFYYTAEGRVDFRDLIREYARVFRVKIEMRQIGARQESARIGGIGSCGRELCCSTWLTDFKSVSTTAARYQNLAINQAKLSGQCGRLKCCLNYELDNYMDALKHFPKRADRLETQVGTAFLVKTDIFKGIMFYVYRDSANNKFYALDKDRVADILAENKKGNKPLELQDSKFLQEQAAIAEDETDFVDVTGEIELPPEERKRRRKKRGSRKPGDRRGRGGNRNAKGQGDGNKSGDKSSKPDDRNRKKGDKNSRGGDKNRPNNEKKGNRNQKSGNKPAKKEDKGGKGQSPKGKKPTGNSPKGGGSKPSSRKPNQRSGNKPKSSQNRRPNDNKKTNDKKGDQAKPPKKD